MPPNHYTQSALVDLARELLPDVAIEPAVLARFFRTVGVRERYLALPAEAYRGLDGLEARSKAWLEVATELGERAIRAALDEVGLDPAEVGELTTTTVTGLAVPSLDARLMNRIPFPLSMKRVPLFGLGCLGGAAGIARVADYLRAYPGQAALLLAVELCSLTVQKKDASVANLISTGLFADGAAAVLLVGAEHRLAKSPGATVLDSCAAFFPNTERAMGWDMVDTGFKVVLGPEVPDLARREMPGVIDPFLAGHGLSRDDIGAWLAHPGGPKVMRAVQDSLGLTDEQIAPARQGLAQLGNLSSASVLFLLHDLRRHHRPVPGTYGLLFALGPAFCAEVVLLQW